MMVIHDYCDVHVVMSKLDGGDGLMSVCLFPHVFQSGIRALTRGEDVVCGVTPSSGGLMLKMEVR